MAASEASPCDEAFDNALDGVASTEALNGRAFPATSRVARARWQLPRDAPDMHAINPPRVPFNMLLNMPLKVQKYAHRYVIKS